MRSPDEGITLSMPPPNEGTIHPVSQRRYCPSDPQPTVLFMPPNEALIRYRCLPKVSSIRYPDKNIILSMPPSKARIHDAACQPSHSCRLVKKSSPPPHEGTIHAIAKVLSTPPPAKVIMHVRHLPFPAGGIVQSAPPLALPASKRRRSMDIGGLLLPW